MKKFIRVLTHLFFLALVLEGALRLQQRLGPIVDLELVEAGRGDISWTLNHVNRPGELVDHPHMEEWKDKTFVYRYDERGIRINPLRPAYPEGTEALKVLFMGDSFMHGFDDAHTVPQHIWEYLQRTTLGRFPLVFLNAACGSYSPAIFVPQAKQLIPAVRPDFVVVDVDETDLGQDAIWYERLIVRDETGSIVAVRPTPRREKFYEGYVRIRKQPSYLVRLVWKWYHERVYWAQLSDQHWKEHGRDPLDLSKDMLPEAREKYREEIAIFERNLSDLSATLIRLMGDRDRIFYLYHPHLGHLKAEEGSRLWNAFVSETLKKVADQYGLRFYDATSEMMREVGERPEAYYLKGDMHFNYDGLKLYSELVAKELLPLLKPYVRQGVSVSS